MDSKHINKLIKNTQDYQTKENIEKLKNNLRLCFT